MWPLNGEKSQTRPKSIIAALHFMLKFILKIYLFITLHRPVAHLRYIQNNVIARELLNIPGHYMANVAISM